MMGAVLSALARPSVMALAVLAISLSMHVLHIAQAGWGTYLWSPFPVSDSFYYLQAAWYRAFIGPGGGYLGHFIPHSPYVRILTAGFSWLGPGSATPFLINGLLMSGAAVFVALISFRVFGVGAGWLAGLAFTFSELTVFFAGLTVKTNSELFFIAGSSYFFIRFLQVSSFWRLFISLLFLGLALIDRNNYAVVLLPYAILAWKYGFPDKAWPFKLGAGVCAGGSALLLMGLMSGWQTESVEQPFFSPVGLNFYVGNSPGSRGTYTVVPGLRDDMEGHFLKSTGLVESWTGRSLTRGEASLFWFKQSWNHYRDRPLDYLALQGRKIVLLFAAESYGLPEQLASARFSRPSLGLAPVSYALVLAFGLATLICTKQWRRKPHAHVLVYALVLYAFTVWVFFVGERYRLLIFMLLLPFAANTLLCLWRANTWNARKPLLLVTIVVFLLSHAATAILDEGPGWADDPQRAAQAEQKAANNLRSLYQAQRDAVATNDAASWHELATYALTRRFLHDAQIYAEKAILANPDNPASYRVLADIYHLRHKRSELVALASRLTSLDQADQSGRWASTRQFAVFLADLPFTKMR